MGESGFIVVTHQGQRHLGKQGEIDPLLVAIECGDIDGAGTIHLLRRQHALSGSGHDSGRCRGPGRRRLELPGGAAYAASSRVISRLSGRISCNSEEEEAWVPNEKKHQQERGHPARWKVHDMLLPAAS